MAQEGAQMMLSCCHWDFSCFNIVLNTVVTFNKHNKDILVTFYIVYPSI